MTYFLKIASQSVLFGFYRANSGAFFSYFPNSQTFTFTSFILKNKKTICATNDSLDVLACESISKQTYKDLITKNINPLIGL